MYHLVLEEIILSEKRCILVFIPCNNAGLDMAIVNSGQITIYDQIPKKLKMQLKMFYLIKMKMQQKI